MLAFQHGAVMKNKDNFMGMVRKMQYHAMKIQARGKRKRHGTTRKQ
jgi:hypothetical protein